MVPQRPFFMGSPGCVRSSAWIWLFSSTHSTSACCGGFRYKPTTSVSFSRNCASRDSLKVLPRCGCSWWLCQMLLTVDLLDPLGLAPSAAAPLRHSLGLGGQRRLHDRRDLALPVAWLAAAARRPLPTGCRAPPARSARATASPSCDSPPSRGRWRCPIGRSAAASTIRLRSATCCGVPNADTHCCSCCASAASSCNAGVERGTLSA